MPTSLSPREMTLSCLSFQATMVAYGICVKDTIVYRGMNVLSVKQCSNLSMFSSKKKGPVVDMQLHFDIVVHGQLADCMRISTSGCRIFACSFIKTKSIPLQQVHENKAVLKPTIHALPVKWDHCICGISQQQATTCFLRCALAGIFSLNMHMYNCNLMKCQYYAVIIRMHTVKVYLMGSRNDVLRVCN